MDGPFVQLDFRVPGVPAAGWRFGPFRETVVAWRREEVVLCLERLERVTAAGAVAAGFMAYEAAGGLDPALVTHSPLADLPLLWFGVCERPAVADGGAAGEGALQGWDPAMSLERYCDGFERIQRDIGHGMTYQVNFTMPLRGRWHGDAGAIYGALRTAAGGAGFCGWIHGPGWEVMSASPELFLSVDGDRVETRPMKGTRPRGTTAAADRALAAELRASVKERAENVMVVDLLRNDVGRVSALGSVEVPALFAVEKYPTVWQMTSTVTGRLRPDAGLVAVMRALFPCGSVTGAPKVSTMGIIRREELGPRGVYCGALGFLGPGRRWVFNVPIRTMLLKADGTARYDVGSGVVADSEGPAEYAECLAKAAVLARVGVPAFELLETLRWTPSGGYWLLERHLARLAESAERFDFGLDAAVVRARLLVAAADWSVPRRVRLLVARDGAVRVESSPLGLEPVGVRRVRLAREPVDSRDLFLYHKTTHRAVYARAAASAGGDADEVLLYNERGELTEAVTANVALLLEGAWLTPPVASGLLAGTLRAELLAAGELVERVVTVADLERAAAVMLFNSVRGKMEATVIGGGTDRPGREGRADGG